MHSLQVPTVQERPASSSALLREAEARVLKLLQDGGFAKELPKAECLSAASVALTTLIGGIFYTY